jgi:hypothetical protein
LGRTVNFSPYLCLKQLERSVAIELLERFERASVCVTAKLLNDAFYAML